MSNSTDTSRNFNINMYSSYLVTYNIVNTLAIGIAICLWLFKAMLIEQVRNIYIL